MHGGFFPTQVWDTAARYHLLHSAVLLVTPFASRAFAGPLVASGIVLFSGSLYLRVLLDQPKFGMITPLGGLALIGGWLSLAL
jgi:uncharacterized membrane protein YgdD (TMEM256/DUF423 family)